MMTFRSLYCRLSELLMAVAIAAVLMVFSVVTNAADTTVTLHTSWSIPTMREDGKPLDSTELAGYQLHYSIDGNEEEVVDIPGGTTNSYALQLPLDYRAQPYTVALSVVAVDQDGLISQPSNLIARAFRIANDIPPAAPATFEVNVSCPNGCRVTLEPL